LVIDAAVADDDDRTSYSPGEVHLVGEVVSPESEERDRKTKPPRYAEAGIAHFWRVEENDGKLGVPVPFAIDIDLDDLPR
jgi:Uma2 family endonuclease